MNRTKLKTSWRIGWALAACAALAAAGVPVRAAGLLVAEGGFGGVLEVRDHDVRVTINNGVAVTEVEQVFVNTEDRVVEALYTFPVPRGASVANFSMWINGKEMVGEVVEKERARQIYESYKQTRKDPGLLEQTDYRTFEMRIFPIPARGEQRVRITYYQELDFDHDEALYVYPLATLTRGDVSQRTTGRFSFNLQSKSEVPITAMSSPSHGEEFVLAPHGPNLYEASLEAMGGDLNRDLVIAYRTERPQTGLDVITSKQRGEDGYLMLTLSTGDDLEKLDVGMDYVFVLDISGSMAQDGKLKLSRESLGAFIDALGPDDRFELITFNLAPSQLFREMKPADDAAKGQAAEHLDSQKARGGTVLRPAIEAAYRYADPDRTLNVVVLSDGLTEQAEQRELLSLIGLRPAGSRVFCIGVGNDVNGPLLRQLAEGAGGLAAFVSRGDDFQRQAQAFRRKLMRPAATGVRITFDGGGVYDTTPAQLPNLYFGTPLRLYGRYREAGKVRLTIEAEVQGKAIKQTHSVELPATDDENPQIERMWAYHRVQELLDESRRVGSPESVRGKVVELCEGYSIVSEHASFIVLENDGEYQRWKIDRRNATRVERDRSAQARLREQLESMRRASAQSIGPVEAERKDQPALATNTPVGQPADTGAAPEPVTQPTRRRGWDLDIPSGGGGGGAIDPVTGAAALGLAGLLAAAGRGRRSKVSKEVRD